MSTQVAELKVAPPPAMRPHSGRGRVLSLIGWACVAALLLFVFQLTAGRSVHNILIVRGDALVSANDYDGALQAYSTAIWFSPGNPASYLKRANVYRHTGQNSLALNDLNQALTLQLDLNENAAVGSLRAHRGANLLQLGQVDAAIADLSTALAENPKDFVSLAQRARAYAARQAWQSSLDDISRALAIRPADARSLAFRARLNIITNRLPEAADDATLAIRAEPRDLRYYTLRATIYFRTGQPELQQQDLTRAIDLDPNQVELYVQRSRSREKTGNMEGALSDLNQAVLLEPQSADLFTERGAFHERINQADMAEQDYHSALEINQNDLQAQLHLGMLLLRRQSPDQAEGELSKAIALSGDNAKAYLKRAQARVDLGKFDAALQDATQAIGLRPNLTQAYLLRAKIRTQMQDLPGATADLSTALTLDENNLSTWLERANLYEKQARYEAAIADFSTVLNRNPAHVPALIGRAHTYRASGANDLAVKDYQDALANLKNLPAQAAVVYPPTLAAQLPAQAADSVALREVQLLSEQSEVLRQLDRLSDAEAALQQAIALDSGGIAMVIRVAGIYQADNKLILAQDTLKQALDTHPDDAVLTLRLVHVLEDQNKYAEAQDAILNSESLRSHRSTLLFQLGALYERHDQLAEAIKVYQTDLDFLAAAVGGSSEASDVQLSADIIAVRMGHLHYLLQHYDQAIAAGRLALRWNPDNALAYRGIGMAMIKLGADCAAIGNLETYLQLAPQAEDAASINAWLQKDHHCTAPAIVPIARILSGGITTTVSIEGRIVRSDNFNDGFKLYLNDGTGELPVLIRAAPFAEIKNLRQLNIGASVRFTGKYDVRPLSETLQFVVSHGPDVSIIVPAADPLTLWQSHTLGELSGNDFNATVVMNGTITDLQPFANSAYGAGVIAVLTDAIGSQKLRLRGVVAAQATAAGVLSLGRHVQVVGHVKATKKVGITIDVLLPQDITAIR